jgi:hypothetical protein
MRTMSREADMIKYRIRKIPEVMMMREYFNLLEFVEKQ